MKFSSTFPIPFEEKEHDKRICEAYGCSNKVSTTIILEAGSKKITVYLCTDCQSKFE